MDAPVLDNQQELIYISSMRTLDVVWRSCREQWMIGEKLKERERERERERVRKIHGVSTTWWWLWLGHERQVSLTWWRPWILLTMSLESCSANLCTIMTNVTHCDIVARTPVVLLLLLLLLLCLVITNKLPSVTAKSRLEIISVVTAN